MKQAITHIEFKHLKRLISEAHDHHHHLQMTALDVRKLLGDRDGVAVNQYIFQELAKAEGAMLISGFLKRIAVGVKPRPR